MRVEQFSIGFPPKLWSFRKGETEYAISAIPLGGYVKISGMIDESLDTETMKQEPQPWEFRSKPAWQRLIVMLGGIWHYLDVAKAIDDGNYQPSRLRIVLPALIVVLIGASSLVWLLW